MGVLIGVEDKREFKAEERIVVGCCTDCGKDIYEEDYRIEFEHDYLCNCCASKMSLGELAAWFGGEYRRGL